MYVNEPRTFDWRSFSERPSFLRRTVLWDSEEDRGVCGFVELRTECTSSRSSFTLVKTCLLLLLRTQGDGLVGSCLMFTGSFNGI